MIIPIKHDERSNCCVASSQKAAQAYTSSIKARTSGPTTLESQLESFRQNRRGNAISRQFRSRFVNKDSDVLDEMRRCIILDLAEILRKTHGSGGTIGQFTPWTVGYDTQTGKASLMLDQSEENKINNFRYKAPEAMTAVSDHEGVFQHSDIYSFAILVWEIVSLETPYQSILKKLSRKNGRKDAGTDFVEEITRLRKEKRLLLPGDLSKISSRPLRKLLQSCWDSNVDGRPNAARVWFSLHHDIFPNSDDTHSSSADNLWRNLIGTTSCTATLQKGLLQKGGKSRRAPEENQNQISVFYPQLKRGISAASTTSKMTANTLSTHEYSPSASSTRTLNIVATRHAGSLKGKYDPNRYDDDCSVYSDELEEYDDDGTQYYSQYSVSLR